MRIGNEQRMRVERAIDDATGDFYDRLGWIGWLFQRRLNKELNVLDADLATAVLAALNVKDDANPFEVEG